MTLDEKLTQLTQELKSATEQINLWTIKKLKIEGAIEALQELKTPEVKPPEVKKHG